MNIDNYLAVHSDALRMRSMRTKVLANNIANSDTPHFKARDIAFAEVMRDVNSPLQSKLAVTGSSSLNKTHSQHIGRSRLSPDAPIMYRVPEQASLDGNTVDKDQEQARFAENSIRYQASLQFMKSRVSGLMRALSGE